MKNKLIIIFLIVLLGLPIIGNAQEKKIHVTSKIPEFPAFLPWLNTETPITMKKLEGQVVLMVFFAYSNIHSLRVLPDLRDIQEKFKDDPFVLIGVHSAKYYSELDQESVENALRRYGIDFPVVVDKEHVLWKKFRVQGWPTFVTVNSQGYGVYVMAGEKRKDLQLKIIKEVLKKDQKDKTLAAKKIEIKKPAIKDTQLAFPTKIEIDPTGKKIYICDSGHHQIVEAQLESPLTAKVVQRIGSGKRDFKNGNYTDSAFSNPEGFTLHNSNLYIADTGNHAIRAVDLSAKTVKTLVGDGTYGPFGKPNAPWDLLYYDGSLYILMAGSHQIWTLDPETNEMDLHAGNGYENVMDGSAMGSCLSQPSAITLDPEQKRFYFLDSGSSSLRVQTLADGHIKTLIGKGLYKYGFADGELKEAAMQHPLGIDYNDGKLYIADTYNNAIRVMDIEKNQLTTIIRRGGSNGEDKNTCYFNGEDHQMPPLYEPNGLVVYNNHLYIADTDNHCIKVFNLEKSTLETLTLIE